MYFDQLLNNIENFYVIFRKVWLKDNKPFGFEVQDERIGGLMMRIRHCRDRLLEYANGKTENIPELHEKIVEYLGGIKDIQGEQTQITSWERIITRGVT